jgi:hypothetical protein
MVRSSALANLGPREKSVIGWREWVALPGLGIDRIRAKIDTGARTSALHAAVVSQFHEDGKRFVELRFDGQSGSRLRRAELIGSRAIRNTSGKTEKRLIISTPLLIAGRKYQMELSLANRTEMRFDLILGRTAIRDGNFLVDPARSFLAEKRRLARIMAATSP